MLGVVWLPLLGGCMATGVLHHAGVPPEATYGEGWHETQATSGDLTIAMSFPTPEGRAVTPIEARLRSGADGLELTDADVWLRIQTPGGSVERLHMQSVRSRAADWYQAQYSFGTAGSYLISADASVKTEGSVQTVSVTSLLEVGGGPHARDGHGWMMPLAVLGGLGMLTMMVLMMS